MQFVAGSSPPVFSLSLLVLMVAVFVVSGMVFYSLSLRWTRDRHRAGLEDWADEHGFELRIAPNAALPPALHSLGSLNTAVESCLTNGAITLVRVVTDTKSAEASLRWNVLIRETEQARTPAGLRPVHSRPSFIDLFSLTEYPSMLQSERFLVCALDSKSAKEMAKSPARGLLPADIGFIVHGPFITLDFSSRPFDTIEFERMIAVMTQVMGHLPV